MRKMGIGLGVGINRSNYAQGIFSAYSARVVADGGVVEGGSCVDAVSSLLQSASLLLIPSGYKGGKLYAEIPTNGNGDLTWTRGGDAFRTNASGVIQRVPWNLLQYSEQFDNSAWIKNNATITSNAINAPNGTLTADKLVETTANGVHNAVFVLSPNVTTYTASFYAKAAERNFVYYSFGGPSWGGQGFMVNLTTGAVSQNTTGATPTITLLPDGWVKIEASRAAVSTTQIQFQIFTGLDSTTFSYTGDSTKGIYIWGAQLVEGTTAQTYLPTTDRLNFPRLSYMYGSCPSALLEPQRTNLAQNSGFVGTGSAPTNWTQPGGTGTSSLTTSNLGVGVQACSQSATAQRPFLQQDFTVSANTTYTFSMYVESISGTINYNNIMFITNPPVGATTSYFLDGVAVNEVTQATTGRLSIRLVVGALTGTISMRCGLGVASSATGSLLFSRPQLEVGAYTTTFILSPVGATATRVADSFSRSNIYTNGLISASGGTWFVELRGNTAVTGDASGDGILFQTTGNTDNFRFLGNTINGRIQIWKRVSNVNSQLYITTTDTTKIAIKWNGSTADVFANGTKVVSGTAFTATQLQEFVVNTLGTSKFIQQMALFPIPLSDTDCATLTT